MPHLNNENRYLVKADLTKCVIETFSVRSSLVFMSNEWIRKGLERPGKTQVGLAKALGIAPQRVQDIVKDRRRVQVAEIEPAARYLGVTPPIDLSGIEDVEEVAEHVRPVGAALVMPIRYKVAAGTWREVEDAVDEPFGWQEVIPLRGVPADDQWLEEVVGDSFNMRYPEGTLVHVRAAWSLDPFRLHGRRVIVQRKRNGGSMIERTVKELVVTTKGGIELWPRSFNPKWSKPIAYRDGLIDGDEVEIVALVEKAILRETF